MNFKGVSNRILLVVAFLAGANFAYMVGRPHAAQSQNFSNRSLMGRFQFEAVDIHFLSQSPFTVNQGNVAVQIAVNQFCGVGGTLKFNGDGTGTVTSAAKCSNADPTIGDYVTFPQTNAAFSYSVAPSGSVTVTFQDGSTGTGQILIGGTTITFNGTSGCPNHCGQGFVEGIAVKL